MKKQIRAGVFESNSSSVHSISIIKNQPSIQTRLYLDDEGNIHSEFGEFGWTIASYKSATVKLSYLLTFLVCINPSCLTMEDFYELQEFKDIENAIKDVYPECQKLVVDGLIKKSDWSDTENEHDGYVDHQSLRNSIYEFLDGISIKDFIFDSNVILHTDHDNY